MEENVLLKALIRARELVDPVRMRNGSIVKAVLYDLIPAEKMMINLLDIISRSGEYERLIDADVDDRNETIEMIVWKISDEWAIDSNTLRQLCRTISDAYLARVVEPAPRPLLKPEVSAVNMNEKGHLPDPSADGSVIAFGNVSTIDGRKIPIEWIVLEKDGNGVTTMFAKTIVSYGRYASREANTNWSESEVRKWLNSKFLKACFDRQERGRIVTAPSENAAADHSNDSETGDRFYIPTVQELEQYMPERKQRACGGSDIAGNRSDLTRYMLRSEGMMAGTIVTVSINGTMNRYGQSVTDRDIGIRPMVRIIEQD